MTYEDLRQLIGRLVVVDGGNARRITDITTDSEFENISIYVGAKCVVVCSSEEMSDLLKNGYTYLGAMPVNIINETL